jgi:hypothetical protein
MQDVCLALESEMVESVPLVAGQRVAILGDSARASEAVTARGALPIMVLPPGARWPAGMQNGRNGSAPAAADLRETTAELREVDDEEPERLPLANAGVDHVLIPAFDPRYGTRLSGELLRVLKPGGSAVVGVRAGLDWPWRGPRPAVPLADEGSPSTRRAHLAGVVRWLEAGRFKVTARYAVYGEGAGAGLLIPLDHPGAVQHFFDHLWVPPAAWQGLVRRCAAMLIAAGRHQWLFKQFLVVAQPVDDGGAAGRSRLDKVGR